MPNVIVDITMSLDRFVTGEHADEQQELGDPPEPTREHAAGCGGTEILEHATPASGAVVRGRRFSEAYLIGDRRFQATVPKAPKMAPEPRLRPCTLPAVRDTRDPPRAVVRSMHEHEHGDQRFGATARPLSGS